MIVRKAIGLFSMLLLLAAPALATSSKYNVDRMLLFQFGSKETPHLKCSPDRVCELVLERNEVIYDKVAGDNVRWILGLGAAGHNGEVPTIFFKPNDVGLPNDPIETNLIVTTNMRTYNVILESVKSVTATRYGFYYPQESLASVQTPAQAAAAMTAASGGISGGPYGSSLGIDTVTPTVQRGPAPGSLADQPAPQALDFGYHIFGDASYRPIAVWNDGDKHTYVKMPPRAEAPSIYAQIASGQLQMINYHPPINDLYTLDGIPDHIVLIGTVGKHVPHIDIQRDGS
jgi:type IV secretory pathway VirB9-like protein